MLAVNDVVYNRFSSAHLELSVLEKRFGGPGKVLEFFLQKRVSTLRYNYMYIIMRQKASWFDLHWEFMGSYSPFTRETPTH